jgi:hypothetical protein
VRTSACVDLFGHVCAVPSVTSHLPLCCALTRSSCGELALLRGNAGMVCIRTAGDDDGAGVTSPVSPSMFRRATAHSDVHVVDIAARQHITRAEEARRFALASAPQRAPTTAAAVAAATGIPAALGMTSPANDSLPSGGEDGTEDDASRFTCGQFIGSFLVTGCSRGNMRVHSLPSGQMVLIQRFSTSAIRCIEVRRRWFCCSWPWLRLWPLGVIS